MAKETTAVRKRLRKICKKYIVKSKRDTTTTVRVILSIADMLIRSLSRKLNRKSKRETMADLDLNILMAIKITTNPKVTTSITQEMKLLDLCMAFTRRNTTQEKIIMKFLRNTRIINPIQKANT
jgi:hypothetical protein